MSLVTRRAQASAGTEGEAKRTRDIDSRSAATVEERSWEEERAHRAMIKVPDTALTASTLGTTTMADLYATRSLRRRESERREKSERTALQARRKIACWLLRRLGLRLWRRLILL